VHVVVLHRRQIDAPNVAVDTDEGGQPRRQVQVGSLVLDGETEQFGDIHGSDPGARLAAGTAAYAFSQGTREWARGARPHVRGNFDSYCAARAICARFHERQSIALRWNAEQTDCSMQYLCQYASVLIPVDYGPERERVASRVPEDRAGGARRRAPPRRGALARRFEELPGRRRARRARAGAAGVRRELRAGGARQAGGARGRRRARMALD